MISTTFHIIAILLLGTLITCVVVSLVFMVAYFFKCCINIYESDTELPKIIEETEKLIDSLEYPITSEYSSEVIISKLKILIDDYKIE